jgi:hypothetical protein
MDCQLVVKHTGHTDQAAELINIVNEYKSPMGSSESEIEDNEITIWCQIKGTIIATSKEIKERLIGTVFENLTSYKYHHYMQADEYLDDVPFETTDEELSKTFNVFKGRKWF